MIREILKIRTDKGLGDNNPSFFGIEISEYSFTATRMGMPQLSADIKFERCLDNEWSGKEYVTLRGERYYIRQIPTSSKDNNDVRYKHSLSFISERDELLANLYFYDTVTDHSATQDKPCSNSTTVKFIGNIEEFVDRLNCAFLYAGVGDSILNTKTDLTSNDAPVGDGYCAMVDYSGDVDLEKTKELSFEGEYIWDAVSTAYETFEIPFTFIGKRIVWGRKPTVIDHIFKYGYDNELLSVQKTNANAKIVRRVSMLGSSENLPYFYPNETEYGHISLIHESLLNGKISIGNYHQLVNRVRADEKAVLKKYADRDVNGEINDSASVWFGFHNDAESSNWKTYTLGKTYRFNKISGIADMTFWYIRIRFDITDAGHYKFSGFNGRIWQPNYSGSGSFNLYEQMSSGFEVKSFLYVTDSNKDITDKTRKDNDGVNLGMLEAGQYELVVYMRIRNEQKYLRLDSVSVATDADIKSGYYWVVGDKTYDGTGGIGLTISNSVLAQAIGTEVSWQSNGIMPFQTNLMPPKYRATEGAERFYNAVNMNLLKGSESVTVVATNNYTHKAIRFDSVPAFKIGDTFTFSVQKWINTEGSPSEYTLALFNVTENVMVIPNMELKPSKKYCTGVVENVPTVENPDIAVIVYAGKYGESNGNTVTWQKVMMVRGEKPMPWMPSPSESGMHEYTDPDTGCAYHFPNPHIPETPGEYIYSDEDVKPTMEHMKNASGSFFGEIAGIAYDSDDNDSLKSESTEDNDKNDALKYEHSYFYIKLNIFNGQYGFDLLKHYSQTDAMTLQMTSGSCNGCKFKVQVVEDTDADGLSRYSNPVQTLGADGMIVSGTYSEKVNRKNIQPWQQNTQTNSIWICVQKDASTFGNIIPNKTHGYAPSVGDRFNIINVDLPQAYIEEAEKRLEEYGMRYMSDNNEDRFTFDIQASRIFFAENPDVLAQLDEYSVLRIEYNGIVRELFVSSFSLECKDSEALPDVRIELSDTIAVGDSFLRNVSERAASLVANAYSLMGSGDGVSVPALTSALADMRYLSKLKSDRTPYMLSSDTGFETGTFVSGMSGGFLGIDSETQRSYLEVDMLRVRLKAIFEELEIAKVSTIGGKFIITPGGGITISFVEELTDSYRCYFKGKDEDKGAECRFAVGDQVQCHEFNIQAGTHQNASNRYYWRLVTAVNNDESYIELSKSDCDTGSDAPMAGDTVVQLGNRNNNERRSAIILSTVDAFAPCVTLYDGIGVGTKKSEWYSLDGKSVVEYGVDKTKNPPEPFFNCYGRFFFGPRNGSTYLRYIPTKGVLEYRGLLSLESSVGESTTLSQYITDTAKSEAKTEADKLAEDIEELKKQVDGVIESWDGTVDPTLTNYPANGWTTDEEREKHIGDLYFNIATGTSFRWRYKSPTDYGWDSIPDTIASQALSLAKQSITGTDVLYKHGNSRTDYPAPLPETNTVTGEITNFKGWSTDAPQWQADKYIWQTTYVRKGDGGASFTTPTCISGRNGQDATPVTISSQSVRYSTEHGATQPADSTFTLDAVPDLEAGQYLWSRTEVMYSNGQPTVSYAVSRIGSDGNKGASYTPNLLVGTKIPREAPENGASTSDYAFISYDFDGLVDFKEGDKYVLSLEDIENIVGNPTGYSARIYDMDPSADVRNISARVNFTKDNPVCVLNITNARMSATVKLLLYAGEYGDTSGKQVRYTKPMLVKGDTAIGWAPASSEMIAPTIVSTSVTYAKTTTNVQPADSAFTYTSIGAVGLGAGDYLWTKTEVTYSDDSSTKSYTVSRIGSDGADGVPGVPGEDGKTPYVHYAYANSANGQTDFSTTYFKDALYVGVCTDYNQTDPTDYTKYEWSRLRGEDGRGILSVSEQYAIHTSGTTAPADSEFSPAIPAMTDAKPYLWNREITTYTDNTQADPTPAVCIGVKGQNGADGAVVISVINRYLASAQSSGVTKDTEGWVMDASHANATTSEEKPYLWNYEVTVWSRGNPTSTDPHVIGKYGKDGVGIDHIEEEYCLSTSSSTPTPPVWYDEEHKPAWEPGKFMWTRTHVYYTDGTDDVFGEVCATGATGTSVLAEYSRTGLANSWHPSYQSGDIWMRTSSDGGTSWSPAIRIVGQNYEPNLLVGTSEPLTVVASGNYSHIAVPFDNPPDFKTGESYTISVEKIEQVSAGAEGYSVVIYDLENSVAVSDRKTITRGNGIATLNIVRNAHSSSVKLLLYAGEFGSTAGSVVTYTKPMLIKGTSPASWCPAVSEMTGTDGQWRKFQWGQTTSTVSSAGIPESEWSDTPPSNVPAGMYVWMRSGIVVPPATSPALWEPAIRLTGDKGTDGNSVYRLDLTDEIVGLPCDADGNILVSLPKTKAKMYRGGTELTSGVTYSIVQVSPSMGPVSGQIAQDGTLTVTYIAQSIKKCAFVIRGEAAGVVMDSTFNIYKAYPGNDGEPATVYSIVPSVDYILKSFSGELSAQAVIVRKYIITGSEPMELTPYGDLKYQRVGVDDAEIVASGHNVGNTAMIQIPPETESVILSLYTPEGALIDRERIPVITDASDIEIGARNIALESAQLTIPTPTGIYTHKRLKLSQSVKSGKMYAVSIGSIYNAMGGAVTSGRFMVKIWDVDATVCVGVLTGIDPKYPYGIIKVTQDCSHPYLYVYAGDEDSNSTLELGAGNQSLHFYRISLVRGNVPLTDWQPAPEDIDALIHKMDYLQAALREKTTIDGGVVLSSVISVGYNNEQYTTQITYAGINGVYDSSKTGGGIALWTGGDMVDLASFYEWDEQEMKWVKKQNVTPPSRIAKGVDRMDGSGYRAGGNLWWDAGGNTTFVGNIVAKGVFAGINKKKKTIINASNLSSYTKYVFPNNPAFGVEIDFEKAGSLIDLQAAPETLTYMPEGDASYIGVIIVIINNTGSDYVLSGPLMSRNVYNSGSSAGSTTSPTIKNGELMQLECRAVKTSATTSEIRWIFEVMPKPNGY